MSEAEKIEIDEKEENKVNEINKNNAYKEQCFKLDFNFDILNEPMPDFNNMNKNNHLILNRRNFGYKRKYIEINNDYNFPGKPTLKLK